MKTPQLLIEGKLVGDESPSYFIADISANHDGDLERAKALVHLAAQAGADAAKFQNFQAAEIVSDFGFKRLGGQQSHQSKWKKSVFEVYKDASIPWEWTPVLKAECRKAGIHYFSTPYDLGAVDMLDPHVPAFKIGSGDVTWPEIIEAIARKGKPVLLATGASSLEDVARAVAIVRRNRADFCLMQCNTNYTGSLENFRHIHLRVLSAYRLMYPDAVLGLSDHTPGHATVLGAVALGARIVEKHFTDDPRRTGPDHGFSMTPATWREMVDRTREVELAMGTAVKEVAENERETVVIQRRCVRAARDLAPGTIIERQMLEVLRPAPAGSIAPYELEKLVGRKIQAAVAAGEHLTWFHCER
ncbi:MAG TPA: N-acetylneuraminate synthase family protein [Opitutaceae bacterium]|nr:N-acetylneuraminate synthase family protein [Lacunisphaera sp.]HWA09184.1 N-acetylneuraminate synthase family protein [Opitutaceae bacterium]